jgi:aconitate hydratase
VLAKSIARIHGENLVNYGVLPLLFVDPVDLQRLEKGTVLGLHALHAWLRDVPRDLEITYSGEGRSDGRIKMRRELSPRQIDIVLAGGAIPWMRRRIHGQAA